ncbi:hypothetical protein AYO45_05730 [Gammaproteobacteria bacterium SCGC AG-212-F23]|nr:hypothetical protein AYO45_05730 [Gammaproteobacteria bacterium SCGC AG-212-F23]
MLAANGLPISEGDSSSDEKSLPVRSKRYEGTTPTDGSNSDLTEAVAVSVRHDESSTSKSVASSNPYGDLETKGFAFASEFFAACASFLQKHSVKDLKHFISMVRNVYTARWSNAAGIDEICNSVEEDDENEEAATYSSQSLGFYFQHLAMVNNFIEHKNEINNTNIHHLGRGEEKAQKFTDAIDATINKLAQLTALISYFDADQHQALLKFLRNSYFVKLMAEADSEDFILFLHDVSDEAKIFALKTAASAIIDSNKGKNNLLVYLNNILDTNPQTFLKVLHEMYDKDAAKLIAAMQFNKPQLENFVKALHEFCKNDFATTSVLVERFCRNNPMLLKDALSIVRHIYRENVETAIAGLSCIQTFFGGKDYARKLSILNALETIENDSQALRNYQSKQQLPTDLAPLAAAMQTAVRPKM